MGAQGAACALIFDRREYALGIREVIMSSHHTTKNPFTLWSDSLGLMVRSFGVIAGIILLYAIVSGVALYLFGAPRATNPLDVVAVSPTIMAVFAILIFQYMLGWIAISFGFSHANDVHQNTDGKTLRRAKHTMPTLILGALVFMGAAALLAVVLRGIIDLVLVPNLSVHVLTEVQMAKVAPYLEVAMLAIWVLVLIRIAFYIPRILLDHDTPWASVQEATELSAGHVTRTFIVMLPSLMLYFGLSFVALKYASGSPTMVMIAAAIVPVVSLPWMISSMVVQYHDLVVRHAIRGEYHRKRLRELNERLHHSHS